MFSLILTDYNTMDESFLYIKRFIEYCIGNVDIILIDNSAKDKGIMYLEMQKIYYNTSMFHDKKVYQFQIYGKNIVLIDAAENGGYSKGNNLGAAYSDFKYNNPYYIFSNNDIEFPQKISLKNFSILFKNNPHIGIIGPNIISPGGGRQNPRKNKGFISQMIFEPYNLMWFRCKFNKWLWNLGENKRGNTGWVSGSFMIVKQSAFNEAGFFDENIFLYAEEIILSERMRCTGYITFYEPGITVIHHHKGSNSDYISRKRNHISLKYYYGTYKRINKILLKFSDYCFEIPEFGYKLRHRNN